MAITIGSNIAALTAQRRLSKNTETASSAMERLGSGLRVNRASDDAAGLAIVASLNFQSVTQGKAVRNLNDGLSLLNIAQTALQELASITGRQEELLLQAANGVYSQKQREALGAEASALREEFDRIVATTSFNGINLLNQGPDQKLAFHVGSHSSDYIQIASFSLGSGEATVGTGTFATAVSFGIGSAPEFVDAADLDNDGNVDLFSADTVSNTVSILWGNGDGTFNARISLSTGAGSGVRAVTAADMNNDGIKDLITTETTSGNVGIYYANGDRTFKAEVSFTTGTSPYQVVVADFDLDGRADFASVEQSLSTIGIFFGNGDGTFDARRSFPKGAGSSFTLAVEDFNRDGIPDLATGQRAYLGNGDGTFRFTDPISQAGDARVRTLGDVNRDGIVDFIAGEAVTNTAVVALGNGNGTFKAGVTLSTGANTSPRATLTLDLNGDGFLDVVAPHGGGSAPYSNTLSAFFGNGDGTFSAQVTLTTGAQRPKSVTAADVNGDGVKDLIASETLGNSISVLVANTKTAASGTPLSIDVSTNTKIFSSLESVQKTRGTIQSQLSTIGAVQSRFSAALANLEVSRINITAAASRIVDVDFAEETALLVASQVRQDVTSAIFAQARQQPSIALDMLRT